ncbi:AI-2E family transporter [Demequina lignilytica]|uniref:AI-2E family transporter n=1 Tax=Demequina lignilytica TaxID=3051663 RepID=A0AB35MIJ9_9MICO|nr:AI-2E family transporter [Demequina sp. SYSU T0a273]MDN4483609.1 AI-2E family transporter [Demequina sp. SYSU T0a273]
MSTPPPPANPPSDVLAAARTDAARPTGPERPAWVDRFVWSVLAKALAAAAFAALAVYSFSALGHLLGVLAISLFFALAMIPGVEALVRRFHMRRGAAVGIIYLAALVAVVLMIAVLIPGIVRFANAVAAQASGWFDHLDSWVNSTFGTSAFDTGGAADGTSAVARVLGEWGDDVLGFVTSGVGMAFDLLTIAAFAFYFAAGFPGLMRAVMRRMPPERQRVFKWIALTSIEQTGGYFYSRLLIMAVNGGLAFVVMAAVGLDLVYAAPLALFMGFVSTFIPFIGTYLGAIVPILVVLAVEGLAQAIILLVWVLVYQQIENYVLSPRLSSKTMELNGAVAFGGALAGGALAGPMGAFMALPVAALITAIVKNTGHTYALIDEEAEDAEATEATEVAEATEE